MFVTEFLIVETVCVARYVYVGGGGRGEVRVGMDIK